MPEKQTESGIILAIQEYRFDLLTDDGRGLLFTMAHNAQPGLDELCRIHAHNIHVTVEYEGEPDLSTGIALRVLPGGGKSE